jgi:hypothetical protein
VSKNSISLKNLSLLCATTLGARHFVTKSRNAFSSSLSYFHFYVKPNPINTHHNQHTKTHTILPNNTIFSHHTNIPTNLKPKPSSRNFFRTLVFFQFLFILFLPFSFETFNCRIIYILAAFVFEGLFNFSFALGLCSLTFLISIVFLIHAAR